ncbi:MAG: hypothetical protein ABIO76_05080 [Ginsengibacter sp.]
MMATLQQIYSANFNQIILAISNDGFYIAQEYLPRAAEGCMSFFIMNGLPLKKNWGVCCNEPGK